jgi:lipoate---protein ligase
MELHLLVLDSMPIYEQLQLEEALLRADARNWCLINRGSTPAIVMGISGKTEQLIDQERLCRQPVALVRRFSGGGTVFVDSQTLFVSWICNASQVAVACCPKKIHQWAAEQYSGALPQLPMRLLDNDYVIEQRKCGGNAQYLCRGRWLHHSSFLWDYDMQNMEYLKMPVKAPAYRQGRGHAEFLCRLKDYFPHPDFFYSPIIRYISRAFTLVEQSLHEAQKVVALPHRKAVAITYY